VRIYSKSDSFLLRASADRVRKVKGAIAVKHIAPFKSNRNSYRLPGQSGDPIALRLIASSKLMPTTCELLNSVRFFAGAAKLLRTPDQTAKP
jgi:hypothetical protein